jgi:hypothetical protein
LPSPVAVNDYLKLAADLFGVNVGPGCHPLSSGAVRRWLVQLSGELMPSRRNGGRRVR